MDPQNNPWENASNGADPQNGSNEQPNSAYNGPATPAVPQYQAPSMTTENPQTPQVPSDPHVSSNVPPMGEYMAPTQTLNMPQNNYGQQPGAPNAYGQQAYPQQGAPAQNPYAQPSQSAPQNPYTPQAPASQSYAGQNQYGQQAPAYVPGVIPGEQPGVNTNSPYTLPGQQQPKKSKTGMIIGISIAAAVCVIGIVLAILFGTGVLGSHSVANAKLQEVAADCSKEVSGYDDFSDVTVICTVQGDTLIAQVNSSLPSGSENYLGLLNGDKLTKTLAATLWNQIHEKCDMDDFKVDLTVTFNDTKFGNATVENGDGAIKGNSSTEDLLDSLGS